MQEQLETSKDAFRETFGDHPRKEDLTILLPKVDDPTEQVRAVQYAAAHHQQFAQCQAAARGTCRVWHVALAVRSFATSSPCCAAQIFVFFPEEVKVGVKTIKVCWPALAEAAAASPS
jgi:hypothetical protein